jgi:ring-1,2-phenylacetyl-CoA epoxidase subunit PaaC
MTPEQRTALVGLLLQLADDELVLGHRDSEWLGLAPHIEEDVAFSSIAQDEVGHATLFYRLLEELGEGRADDLAFLRPAAARRNAVLLERPNGQGTYLKEPRFDWAFTIVRHFCYDLFDQVRLEALAACAHQPLAQAAVKIRREEHYHLLHHRSWFRRLAQGTPEAQARLAAAIAKVWPEVGGLPEGWEAAVAAGVVPPVDLRGEWLRRMEKEWAEAGLIWPGEPPAGPVRAAHTPDLHELVGTMAEVYRSDPAAAW